MSGHWFPHWMPCQSYEPFPCTLLVAAPSRTPISAVGLMLYDGNIEQQLWGSITEDAPRTSWRGPGSVLLIRSAGHLAWWLSVGTGHALPVCCPPCQVAALVDLFG